MARGELEITDVNNAYIADGLMEYDVLEGFWGDAGESIDAYYEVNDFVRGERRKQGMVEGIQVIPLRRVRGRARLVHGADARLASCRCRCASRTSSSRAEGVIRGLHCHERGQDDLFACVSGDSPRGRAQAARRRGFLAARTSAIENPVAIYIPGRARTASRRSPTCSFSTT